MLQQPFKTYNGGKSGNGTYQSIINHIPECNVFIDGFVGNGGIVCHLNLPDLTVINDIDPGIIDAYDCPAACNIVKENLHVADLIAKYDVEGSDTFFYFDPPYLKSARKNSQDLYKYEMSVSDHQNFLSQALNIKSNCMISHYPCSIYDEALSTWNKVLFQSMTRKGLATECIYMNYFPPFLLQDYRYLGKNYIDRQRIKRKVARWIAKINALPFNEASLLVASITEAYKKQNRNRDMTSETAANDREK